MKINKAKPNFVVSMIHELWDENASEIVAADKYIEHKVNSTNLRYKYINCRTVPAIRKNTDDIRRDRQWIESYYKQFLDVVISRLNEVHGDSLPRLFWEKALQKSLLRHLSLCFDMYKVCDLFFEDKDYKVTLMDPTCFFTPTDFSDHRFYFEDSDFGREQLFSIYCKFVYGNKHETRKVTQPLNESQLSDKKVILTIIDAVSTLKKWLKRKLKRRVEPENYSVMLIIDCTIQDDDIKELNQKSKGLIQYCHLPENNLDKYKIDKNLRSNFSRPSIQLNEFGNYCLAVLETGMPILFLEGFSASYDKYEFYFKSGYPKLLYVVCEWWISFSKTSFALAVLSQMGIKHISLEHNCITHVFEASPIKYFSPLVDEYLTLGWNKGESGNVIGIGSLYPWIEEASKDHKNIDCLLILAAPVAYLPEFSFPYGFNGNLGVGFYFEMMFEFFSKLDKDIIKKMYIRGYPVRSEEKLMMWDQAYVLQEYINSASYYDDDSCQSTKSLIAGSKFVIVTYLSTVYLESLMANVPTVIFWNRDAYPLEDSHQDYFDELLRVGICQTKWNEAASFVMNHIDNPQEWWSSEDVQKARKIFLDKNIHNKSKVKQYLLSKATLIETTLSG